MDKTILERITKTFTELTTRQRVSTRPVNLKFNGKLVKTASGKHVWRNIGHAKCALRNHLEHAIPYNTESRDALIEEFMAMAEFPLAPFREYTE